MPSPITDDVLLSAIRQKILDEINKKQEAQAVIQNIIGSTGARGEGAGSVYEALGGAPSPDYVPTTEEDEGETPPGLEDYFVDIMKEDIPGELDPEILAALEGEIAPDIIEKLKKEAAKPKGWKKTVHRYKKEDKKEDKQTPKSKGEGEK